jgi:hypothetical protein
MIRGWMKSSVSPNKDPRGWAADLFLCPDAELSTAPVIGQQVRLRSCHHLIGDKLVRDLPVPLR